MKTPAQAGLPADLFPEWRKGQAQAVTSLLFTKDRFNLLCIPTGGGKCHRRGQGLLRSDGRVVKVEDVRVGDRLLGPGSASRIVLALARGQAQMFEIRPVKGQPWVVNGDHQLTVVRSDTGIIQEFPVTDWFKWCADWKRLYKLMRADTTLFEKAVSSEDLPLEPYFLGILLGDGSLEGRVAVCKPDPEILAEVQRQARIFGLRVRSTPNSTGCPTHCLSGTPSRWHKNPIMARLEDLGLRGVESSRRFVPTIYRTATQKARAAILAGLLDTDGSMAHNGYDFISKSQQLANDVVFLARSLGLAAYPKECRKGCQGGFVGTYYRVSISGDTDQIPCRIPRKQASPRLQRKSVLRTGFTVHPLEVEDYYGFTLDGDGRYLLDDFTITHNSAVYMGVGGIDSGRTIILTATRALQQQNLDNFRSMGLVDVRGRANYVCDVDETKTAADAKCTAGTYCRLMKDGGCGYYDRLREARQAQIVQTNYRFWLHAEESGSLGYFSNLILDEAHKAPDEISDFAAVYIGEGEIRAAGISPPPWTVDGKGRPAGWASLALHHLECQPQSKDPDRRRRARDLQRRLARLCRLSDSDWLGSRPDRRGWRWDLVDPGSLAEDLLFRGASRVILASASARKKTLQLLGVDGQGVKVQEQESTFPVKRRPIYYWPVARVGRDMSSFDEKKLHEAIDDVIDPRTDRRGYIPTVSYDRAVAIYNRSRHKRKMILHRRGEDAAVVLRKFLQSPASTILVSPAFNTGTDFAGRQCEYIIVPKMPFPDSSSPLMKARQKRDKTYGLYLTLQALVQTVGRGMRSADDQCESIILDGNFGWLRHSSWDFMPRHFHASVRSVPAEGKVPDPPPCLEDQGWPE